MNEIFEFIFANFFLFFIILAGLLSFLRNMLANQPKQKDTKETTKEDGSPLRDVVKRLEEMVETFENQEQTIPQRTEEKLDPIAKEESAADRTFQSIEDESKRQYEEQYNRLKEQYQSISQTSETSINETESRTLHANEKLISSRKTNKEEINIELNTRLNREGLIESIIMHEVLGPPRARRKHHRLINR